jgi:hypothetical protein
MPAGEASALAASGGACSGDDVGLGHLSISLICCCGSWLE